MSINVSLFFNTHNLVLIHISTLPRRWSLTQRTLRYISDEDKLTTSATTWSPPAWTSREHENLNQTTKGLFGSLKPSPRRYDCSEKRRKRFTPSCLSKSKIPLFLWPCLMFLLSSYLSFIFIFHYFSYFYHLYFIFLSSSVVFSLSPYSFFHSHPSSSSANHT